MRRSGMHSRVPSSTETAVRLMAIEQLPRRAYRRRAVQSPSPFRWLWLLAGPVAYALQRAASGIPEVLETVYARGFYPIVTGAWSRLTGLFPFSLMEVLLMLLAAATPVLLFLWIRGIRRTHGAMRTRAVWLPVGRLLMVLSLWYALSVPLWNLQYAREDFLVLSGLDASPTDTATLAETVLWLAEEANAARLAVLEDENGVMRLSSDVRSSLDKSSSGYDILSERFSFLAGQYGRPKPVMLSSLMSWTRIVGIFTVTTAEANVDVAMPDVEIPFTALHELAHQRGVAREDEANAVAWMASRVHPDPDHRYSGALQAYIYASNALIGVDRNAWNEVRTQLSPAVLRDLDNQSAYWKRYDTVVDKVAEKANDTWLKTQGEAEGVRSYGRMVDLVLAEHARLLTLEEVRVNP